MAEDGDAAGEKVQQQRAIGVLVEGIERGVTAGEDLVGEGDVTQVIAQPEADEEQAPERDGGEENER
jgi:hypothetical protein